MQKADALQEKCDKEDFITDDPKQDLRAQGIKTLAHSWAAEPRKATPSQA